MKTLLLEEKELKIFDRAINNPEILIKLELYHDTKCSDENDPNACEDLDLFETKYKSNLTLLNLKYQLKQIYSNLLHKIIFNY